MSSDIVRTGVIGCGGIAQHAHLPSILRNPKEQLVAVSDSFEDLARKIAVLNGLKETDAYADYRALLERKDIDAVTVCAWTGVHAEIVVAALQAGKHVLVEKPMAVTSDDARQMVQAADSTGRTLMIAYNHTYDLATEYVGRMLKTGELGDILYAEVFFCEDHGAWDAGAYRSTVRSATPVKPGTRPTDPYIQLLHYVHNFDSHVINLMRVLIGEPKGIEYAKWIPKSGLWAMLDYGTYKTFFKNVETGQRRFEKGIEIYGRNKRVRLDLAPPSQRYTPGVVTITDAQSQTVTTPMLEYRWPFELEHEHFSQCVLEGKQPLTNGHQALPDVVMAEDLARLALKQ